MLEMTYDQLIERAIELAMEQEERFIVFAQENGRHNAKDFYAEPVELNTSANIAHLLVRAQKRIHAVWPTN